MKRGERETGIRGIRRTGEGQEEESKMDPLVKPENDDILGVE